MIFFDARIKKIRRFTLIEVLSVVAILAAVVAIGVGVFNLSRQKIAETRTTTLVTKVSAAIDQLYGRYGVYPNHYQNVSGEYPGILRFPVDAIETSSGVIDIDVLRTDSDSSFYGFSEDYITDLVQLMDLPNSVLKDGQTFDDDYYTYIDSWGRPLFYRYPGAFRTSSFDLCSAGRDGMGYYEKIYNFAPNNQGLADVVSPVWEDGLLASSKDEYSTSGVDAQSANDEQKLLFTSEYGDDITNF